MSTVAFQRALRGRLAAFPAVVALVPPANIGDRHGRPAAFPCIIMGEDQEADAELTLERRHRRVFVTLHTWDRSPALVTVKAITAVIGKAIEAELPLEEGRLLDLKLSGARYLRDPDGVTAHGVVTLEALLEEARP